MKQSVSLFDSLHVAWCLQMSLWHSEIMWSCDLAVRARKNLEVRFWRCAEAKSCGLTCHISLESKQATHHHYHCRQKEFKFCMFIRFRTDKSALKPTRFRFLAQQPYMCVQSWKKSSVTRPYNCVPCPAPGTWDVCRFIEEVQCDKSRKWGLFGIR